MTVARLFTPKIANLYEEYYRAKGVKFVKGTVLTSFEFDSNRKVRSFLSSKDVWYCASMYRTRSWEESVETTDPPGPMMKP